MPYEVDSDTFYRLIRNDKKKPTETEKQEEIEEDKNTLLDIGLDYGVPIILIIVSSLIAISVGNIIYRKQKHGI